MKVLGCLVAVCIMAAIEAGVIPYHPGYYGYSLHFHGHYPGSCGNDGMYYNDDVSFVVCTNGNAYIQQCAPGTRNGGVKGYHVGSKYSNADFCGVNLNDYGYGAHYKSQYYPAGYYNHPHAFY